MVLCRPVFTRLQTALPTTSTQTVHAAPDGFHLLPAARHSATILTKTESWPPASRRSTKSCIISVRRVSCGPAGSPLPTKRPAIMQTRPVLWLSPAGSEAITSTLTESWPPIPGLKENMSARTAKRPVRHAITAGSQKAVPLIIMTQKEIR